MRTAIKGPKLGDANFEKILRNMLDYIEYNFIYTHILLCFLSYSHTYIFHV